MKRIEEVAQVITDLGSGIVMLDGCAGCGKSTLARGIRDRIGDNVVAWIEVDHYLNKNQGRFVDALRMDELNRAIVRASQTKSIIIVEGVCARAVAAKAGFIPSLFIYVVRQGEVIAEGEDQATPDIQLTALDAEIWDYHWHWKPRRSAHFVYVWIADEAAGG
jgi:hypothetical protein